MYKSKNKTISIRVSEDFYNSLLVALNKYNSNKMYWERVSMSEFIRITLENEFYS